MKLSEVTQVVTILKATDEQTSKEERRWEMLWNLEFKRELRTNELTTNYFLGLPLNSYLR